MQIPLLSANEAVNAVFNRYPTEAYKQLMTLRTLIYQAAHELAIHEITETLKWGEPSYLTKHGSTVRIDFKAKKPNQVAIYFKCTSKLVPTFKAVYGNLFTYEGTRAIVFKLDQEIPQLQVKACIKAALVYHLVKNKPMLNMMQNN